MAKYKLLLPKMGESVAEATVIKWTKKPGDHVETDETVMEIATDKVDSDVPSPVTGKLVEQLCQENDVVQVGAVIAIIETGEPEEVKAPPVQAAAPVPPVQPVVQHYTPTFHIEETPAPKVEETTPPPTPAPQFHRPPEPVYKAPEPVHQPPVEPVYKAPGPVHQPFIEPVPVASTPEEIKPPVFAEQREDLTPPVPYIEQTEHKEIPAEGKNELRFYSPLVKNIASQEGISNEELDKIPGTGAEGRLTKDDLLNYIQNKFTITSPTINTVVPEEHVNEVEEMKSWPEAHSIETETAEVHFEESHSPVIEPVTSATSEPAISTVESIDAEPTDETPESVTEHTAPQPEVEEPNEAAVAEPIAETITPGPVAEIPSPEPVVEARKAEPVIPPAVKSSASMNGGDEIIEMDRMRRLIADHMVMSKHTSPHVTSFVEADVTNLVLWREKMKGLFEKREGEKITFTPLFIEAVVRSIKDYPMINVQVNGTQIIKKKDINISMATALPSGNLIVPVIKRADELNLVGLTKAVNDLASRARNGKLKPDDVQGGTFTITNVGSFGNVMGTPIINQPQVAILAVGAIKKKPAVIETLQGDMIGIRHMMFLSLSYDHRVVDGALGGSFVRRVADYLENWDPGREI